jgi:glycosyltransferase involved in cell wall biosynthesis
VSQISLIVPLYNERENLESLHREIREALERYSSDLEILYVDDGSTDGSAELVRSLAAQDQGVTLIRLRRNFGQTAAMQAGIDEAQGEILVLLDADLQNDPADIPAMVAKLEEGYDLVCGWRRDRQDAWITRKLPSRIANWLIGRVTRVPIRDLGCTLKVLRRSLASELELLGEMHRFIPILAHQRGARCAEVDTHHRPRRFGQSKYGLSRTLRVVLDLITVKFLLDYLASPMKFFGRLGFACLGLGLISLMTTVGMKSWGGVDMTGNPLLLLSVFAFLAGLQVISLGILGEMSVRIYFDRQGRRPYAIAERFTLRQEPAQVFPIHRAA